MAAEHVVASPLYVPLAVAQRALVVTSHPPEAKQHAPVAGGVGHPPADGQVLFGPKNFPSACAHAARVWTVQVLAPAGSVTQQAPVSGPL